jgi:tripartite-type tricarboxylate transporter receptor subunit TctC
MCRTVNALCFHTDRPSHSGFTTVTIHLILLNQQVIVENVAGAGGMTGTSRVAKAALDGYQFGMGGPGIYGYNQTLYKNPL